MKNDAFIRFLNDYNDYTNTLNRYEEAYYEYYAWKHRSLDTSIHELALNDALHYGKDREPFVDIDQIVLNLED